MVRVTALEKSNDQWYDVCHVIYNTLVYNWQLRCRVAITAENEMTVRDKVIGIHWDVFYSIHISCTYINYPSLLVDLWRPFPTEENTFLMMPLAKFDKPVPKPTFLPCGAEKQKKRIVNESSYLLRRIVIETSSTLSCFDDSIIWSELDQHFLIALVCLHADISTYRVKIYTEFNLATWLLIVKFTG